MEKHYFPHDYSARNDQKVLQLRFNCGIDGYGIYWMILETMAEDTIGYIQKKDMGGLSLGYGVPIEKLQSVFDNCVSIGLFVICEHGNYYSVRMLEHKQEMEMFTKSGANGAKIRWENERKRKEKNSQPIAPPLQGVMQLKESKEKNNTLFDTFWKEYPKKDGKQAAIKAFNKIKTIETILPLILSALKWQCDLEQWKRDEGQFIPHAATYLNNKRWEDQQIVPQPKGWKFS